MLLVAEVCDACPYYMTYEAIISSSNTAISCRAMMFAICGMNWGKPAIAKILWHAAQSELFVSENIMTVDEANSE